MRFTFILMLMLGFAVTAGAQGTVAGKITDGKTGEPLIGVTVWIPKMPSVGTVTDVDGKYELKVPDGVYEVQVKYMGYETKEIADVKVTKGNVVTLNAAVNEEKTKELQGVIVRSTLKRETLNALYITQKNAATVSDGISAEAIKKSPDKSTGEVLKRVSGTTIQDNKFVIIRGLSDRYNAALIDNAFLPSTEPNRKAFSFDIIPAALIDNIVISKSATPDLPGDFAGGAINILTREMPDANFNSISIGTTYNTVATFNQFQTGYKTATDILGFDNGARQLPKGLPASESLTGRNVGPDESLKYLSMLNNDLSITDRKGLPGASLQASLGRLYKIKNGNNRFGLTAALTYNHTENVKKDVERIYGDLNVKDQVYNYNTNLGALLNLGYSFGSSKIVLKNLYNRTFDDNFLSRDGYDFSRTSFIKYYAYDLIQKSLFKTSLEGDHKIGEGQSKINWLLSYNYVGNNQPDQRKVSYARQNANDPFSADIMSLGKANNRLFSDLNESIVNAGVNFSTPYRFLVKSSLKIGVMSMYRHRDFTNRYIGGVLQSGTSGSDEKSIREASVDQIFSQSNLDKKVFQFVDQTGPGDAYKATAITNAAYAMSDNKITDKLRIVWGVRMESYNLKIESPALLQSGQKVDTVWNDLLPSANLSYALNDKSNLRFSYFKSVARPELREVAPIDYYDYELITNIAGNPRLTRGRIDNLDLRYEIFPRAGEVLSGSVFYKRFGNTIENFMFGDNSSTEIQTRNYGTANNIGAELEIRKALDFIGKAEFLKQLSFYANLAYIHSKVELKGDNMNYRNGYRNSRPLSGQSPYVINTGLSYNALEGKLNFNVLYNRIGQRIAYVGGKGKFADVYEAPRNLLDFQVAYNLSKRSEFRLNVKDILNSRIRFYYDQNDNKKFDNPTFSSTSVDPDQDFIFQQYRPGTTLSLTYTYKF